MAERTVTLKGNPVNLVGPELQVGSAAPDFTVVRGDLSTASLADIQQGKTLLVAAVLSLDTPVCDQETRRWSEETANLPETVKVVTISCDLPFAQKRWCGDAQSEMECYSDHRETSFGQAYGVLIGDLRVLARSIFVIGPDGTITYKEIVPEVADHPNYDAALAAVKG
ncbi:MAG: thiol peroxidase [Nitrospinae bacterium]|nr:thiol peroxidase [Nitrospinota bacterium]